MNTTPSANPASLMAVQRRLATIQPDPRNPRQHSPRQIKQIARSIKSFGFNVPILIDRQDKILCGHGRYLAAQQLGLNEVPAIQLEHLTAEQARAFAIADNRLTENATWDDALLGEIFAELSVLDLDFSLETMGFTMGEIDVHIEGITSADTKSDAIDQFASDETGPSCSQPGDLWLLGKHRILCANALEKSYYDILMRRDRAHLVFTDPPYNVPIQGHVSGQGKIRHREFAMASGEMDEAQFTRFLTQTFEHLAAHSHPGSIHFICMDWRHLSETLAAGKVAYSDLKNICVWAKDKGGMGSLYRSQHELVLVFKHGAASHRNNVELGQYGRNRTNVWNYPGANTTSRQSGEGNLLALHPTVKPVALIADAIMDCSARGEIVVDCFLGSGSTLLAAERVGRVCYGMELDPLYVDTAVRRWQTYTGEVATHATTGRTFNELQTLRQTPPVRRERVVLHG
jgi:DNA modification methylase